MKNTANDNSPAWSKFDQAVRSLVKVKPADLEGKTLPKSPAPKKHPKKS